MKQTNKRKLTIKIKSLNNRISRLYRLKSLMDNNSDNYNEVCTNINNFESQINKLIKL
jgi:hypothetical protein